MEPYQNFQFVVENYDVVPYAVEVQIARILPWIEFFAGLGVFLGLWLRAAMKTAWGLFSIFLIVVGQAIVRKLPLDECGCFGDSISLSLTELMALDASFWLMCFLILRNIDKASVFSLDKKFN